MSTSSVPVSTLLEALAVAPPERPFVTMWNDADDVHTVCFGEFTQQARVQAAYFLSHGLRCGDRIILILPQGIPLMTAFVGAMLLGAVPAILAYPNFKVEPAKYRLGLAGVSTNLKARLVVIDDAFPSELLEHIAAPDGVQIVRSA
ncbi:MAG: fatty acyl-AMP ligase, partial [Chloroflexi bacterium]|nr:fatty acyl-AMP ligase [Chloroflexota bacterium]